MGVGKKGKKKERVTSKLKSGKNECRGGEKKRDREIMRHGRYGRRWGAVAGGGGDCRSAMASPAMVSL